MGLLTSGLAVRLNQVTVGCTDYEDSVCFYETLGLRRIVDAHPAMLASKRRPERPSGSTTWSEIRSSAVIYFEVGNVDAAVARLSADGLLFDLPARDESWLWRESRLRDPAGNEICLYHAGENRRFPLWRV